MQKRFAIESGWYYAVIPASLTKPEIAAIYKGSNCVVLLRDETIVDIEPDLDPFDKNIINTIISANLGYEFRSLK